jgi:hypothetical protein
VFRLNLVQQLSVRLAQGGHRGDDLLLFQTRPQRPMHLQIELLQLGHAVRGQLRDRNLYPFPIGRPQQGTRQQHRPGDHHVPVGPVALSHQRHLKAVLTQIGLHEANLRLV